MAPLTGRDAVDNVRLLMRLGNTGARFDARRLAAACRTARGRARVTACLRRPAVRPTACHAAAVAPSRPRERRAIRTAAPPGRPRPAEGR